MSSPYEEPNKEQIDRSESLQLVPEEATAVEVAIMEGVEGAEGETTTATTDQDPALPELSMEE